MNSNIHIVSSLVREGKYDTINFAVIPSPELVEGRGIFRKGIPWEDF